MTAAAIPRGQASISQPHRTRTTVLVVAALLVASPVWGSARAQTPQAAGEAARHEANGEAPAALPKNPTEIVGDAPATGGRVAAELEFSAFDDKLFLAARKSGEPVVLYFEADWCAPCKEMHARTFREPAVLEAAAGARFFSVDMTTPSPYLGLLQKSFRVSGAPTVVVFGPDGKERARRFGFIPPEDFVKMLDEGRKPSPSS